MLRTYAALPFALIGLLPAQHAHHRHRAYFPHHRECHSIRCAREGDRRWFRKWLKAAVLTWYSTEGCDPTGGGGMTANETTPGWGEVANSVLPFGTVIEVSPPIMGRRRFVVEDRFGSQQAANRFDVWAHCGDGASVPSTVRYRIVR